MIRINFDVAITIYLSLVIIVVIGKWIFYTYSEKGSLVDHTEYLQQCPFCTFVFHEYRATNVTMCPRCHSYVAIGGTDSKDAKP